MNYLEAEPLRCQIGISFFYFDAEYQGNKPEKLIYRAQNVGYQDYRTSTCAIKNWI